MVAVREEPMRHSKRPNKHTKLESLLKEIKIQAYTILEDGVKLSKREHRGKPCKYCKKPEANDAAHVYATNEGDCPDLCWGDCEPTGND